MKQLSNIEVLQKGWDVLVRTIGPKNAQRFIVSFPKGERDSVAYWKNFWGKKTVDEIHQEILKAKKAGEI